MAKIENPSLKDIKKALETLEKLPISELSDKEISKFYKTISEFKEKIDEKTRILGNEIEERGLGI